jgi:hypothetical protein
VPLGAGAILCANGALDPHELESHQVELVEKHISGSGADQSHHVTVVDWRAGHAGQTLSFQLFEPSVFHRLKEGDKVIVAAGPGLFGWWVREVIPLSRQGKR